MLMEDAGEFEKLITTFAKDQKGKIIFTLNFLKNSFPQFQVSNFSMMFRFFTCQETAIDDIASLLSKVDFLNLDHLYWNIRELLDDVIADLSSEFNAQQLSLLEKCNEILQANEIEEYMKTNYSNMLEKKIC